jgi:hypothetical protein
VNIDIELSEDERSRLRLALGRNVDPDRVAEVVAKAGAREALDYATGVAVFSSMADLRSYRIACLLRAGITVSEAEVLVRSLFKVTTGTARHYVNAALARYRVELGEDLRKATAASLEAATWDRDAGRWLVTLPTTVVRERIMDLLSQEELPDPTTAERGALWKVPNDTFQWLRAEHGLSKTKPPK